MYDKYKKYCTIHNTDTQHTVIATQLNTKRKYTTITVVHNIYSGVQHIHETETFGLPEGQIASTMISVSLTGISVLGVVVRGAKKHYVNVKSEQTLSTLWSRN